MKKSGPQLKGIYRNENTEYNLLLSLIFYRSPCIYHEFILENLKTKFRKQ